MKHGFLNNALTLYLSTGIMAGMLCFICLTMSTYRKNLDVWQKQLSSVTVRAVKMKNAVAEMDKTIVRLREMYPAVDTQSCREALLATADELRRILHGCRVTLGDIQRDGGELLLPISIAADSVRYADIVSCIGALQGPLMPYISIQSLAVDRPERAVGGDRFTCALEIAVRMPDDEPASH